MSGKHKLPEDQAKAAKVTYGLLKPRKLKSADERKSKPRNYDDKRKHCPIAYCNKSLLRIDNHLRQFHRLKGDMFEKWMKQATPCGLRNGAHKCDGEMCLSNSEEIRKGSTVVTVDSSGDKRNDEINPLSQEACIEIPPNNRETCIEIPPNQPEAAETSYVTPRDCQQPTLSCENDQETESDVDDEDPAEPPVMVGPDEEKLLKDFKVHMASVDGGRRSKVQIDKEIGTLQQIVRFKISEDPCVNYQNLADRTFLNEWMTAYLHTREPSTVKTYSTYIAHFLNFIEVIDHKAFDMTKVRRIQASMKQWRKVLTDDAQTRSHKKRTIKMQNHVTAAELRKFDTCEDKEAASKFFKKYEATPYTYTRSSFCLARDFLITRIILDNHQRPGAISNFTMEEYYLAKKSIEGYKIEVFEHKTKKDGPAVFKFTHDEYRELKCYINNIRTVLLKKRGMENKRVFLSTSGRGMSSTMVTSRFSHCFVSNARDGEGPRVNPTEYRKFSTNKVHQYAPELKQATADIQRHSIITAEKHYAHTNLTRNIHNDVEKIKKVLRTDYDKVDNVVDGFEEEIESGEITLDDVREKAPHLPKDKQKKKLDAVRYQIRKRANTTNTKRKTPQESDLDDDDNDPDFSPGTEREEDESDADHQPAPPKGVKRARRDFTPEETALVNHHLQKYIKDANLKLAAKDMEKVFKGIPELKDLFARYGVRGLIVKIRTERTKRT